MVLNSFLGIGVTAKVYLLEPKYHIFTGCDVDSDCVAKMMPSVLLISAEQVLSRDLDLAGSREV